MVSRAFPWKFLLRRAAARHGVMDPLTILARLRRFSQPSDIQEPIELIRTGIERQAQGLVNTKAIQSNMDWIWPYWVERQFRPDDPSFVPRGFTLAHVNLTHRNWTAVSMPDCALYPLVDDRGLVTPLFGGWSIDFWLVDADGSALISSRLAEAQQVMAVEGDRQLVRTKLKNLCGSIETEVWMEGAGDQRRLCVSAAANILNARGGDFIITVRPYNVEGVQFIEHLSITREKNLLVNKHHEIQFSRPPGRIVLSDYTKGDVFHRLKLRQIEPVESLNDPVGMGTAAAVFPCDSGQDCSVSLQLSLEREFKVIKAQPSIGEYHSWQEALHGRPRLEVPDARMVEVFQNSVISLIQLSAEEIYPGPLTYKRFWFRDACLMLHPIICCGMIERARRAIDGFSRRQKSNGYYHSQEGEWDSNGQVLWIMLRYSRLSGKDIPENWKPAVHKAAEWIIKKRLTVGPELHRGLLPVGFSAEHFGSTDFYYWEDFWAVHGLRAAATLAGQWGQQEQAAHYAREADAFLRDILRSIDSIEPERGTDGAMPTGPYRRMDAASVGALVSDYPLRIFEPNTPRVSKTLEFLLQRCFYRGALFHDLSHAGLNIYLSLAIAQSLLRNGDTRYEAIVRTVCDLASPTGHWPEAIHPRTLAGSMGDGQHGWASGEWVMMIRNMFIREEGDRLILLSGVLPEWIEAQEPLAFGPTQTDWGRVSVRMEPCGAKGIKVDLDAQWHERQPVVEIRIPGHKPQTLGDRSSMIIQPEA